MSLLPDPFLGKIILFEPREGELVLGLRSSVDQEWWVDLQRGREPVYILAAIRQLPDAKGYDDSFGFHREIPHRGEVLGGGIALFLDGVLYIDCQSLAYGPLRRDLVSDILSRCVCSILPDKTIQIRSTTELVAPIPFYLGRDLIQL